ncbi:MAG: hypothetical protein MZV70_01145 [Desulfobacterales bacterium]|nr:hypothetical protein [Desulfobacterales bacterium]
MKRRGSTAAYLSVKHGSAAEELKAGRGCSSSAHRSAAIQARSTPDPCATKLIAVGIVDGGTSDAPSTEPRLLRHRPAPAEESASIPSGGIGLSRSWESATTVLLLHHGTEKDSTRNSSAHETFRRPVGRFRCPLSRVSQGSSSSLSAPSAGKR